MAQFLYGDRIAKLGAVKLGCSVVVLDSTRERLLLTKRTDNGRWCLPGGHIEPGESVTEGAIRETREETGLDVELMRLVGVYSNPNRLLEYADGNRFHVVALNFEAKVVGGELAPSDETVAFEWCSQAELHSIDLMEHHVERIEDVFRGENGVFVR